MSTDTSQIAIDAASRITTLDTAATAAMTLLNGYMSNLLELAGLMPSYNTVTDARYAGTVSTFSDVDVPAFDQLDDADSSLSAAHETAGAMTNLDAGITKLLAEFQSKLAVPEARLDTISEEAMAMAPPTAESLGFNEDNYIADIIDEVKDAIKDSLSQDPGEATASESRHYGNDRGRRLVSNQKELTDTLGEFAGRGFSLPAEILDDVATVINAKQAADYLSAEKEILIQQEALSLENRWKAIDAGVRYDQILLTLYERKMQRALTLAKTIFKLGQDLVEVKFAVLDALAAARGADLAAVAEGRKIVMEAFRENTRKFGAKIDALITETGTYLDAYQADAAVYEETRRAAGEIAAFDQSENKIHLQTLLSNVQNSLTTADENLEAFARIADMRLVAAEVGTDMQTSLAKAVRRRITTVVQLLSGNKYNSTGTP